VALALGIRSGHAAGFVVALREASGQLQATQLVVSSEAVHGLIVADLAVLLAFQSIATVQGETTPARRLVVSSLAVTAVHALGEDVVVVTDREGERIVAGKNVLLGVVQG